jgi:GTP cyclohydrolase I
MKSIVEEKKIQLEYIIKEILIAIGEDPHREGLLKTPQRVAKTLKYLTQGYTQSLEEIVGNAIFEEDAREMIVIKNIELFSLCEHHLLPFYGKCHVGYIPNGKIIGASKIPRIVDYYSRRLQVQEKLTKQIAETINNLLSPLGVGVVIEAKHLCMIIRGVQKQNSELITSHMLGAFRKRYETRMEFLNFIRNG